MSPARVRLCSWQDYSPGLFPASLGDSNDTADLIIELAMSVSGLSHTSLGSTSCTRRARRSRLVIGYQSASTDAPITGSRT
jgi:hypothetical protein